MRSCFFEKPSSLRFRLALDSAISRLQGAKKEKEIPKLEMEVEEAKERLSVDSSGSARSVN